MGLRDQFNSFMASSARRRLQVVAGAVASVGLAWVVAHSLDWGTLGDIFRDFPVGLALLSFALVLVGSVLRASRWHVLLHRERVSFWQVFLTQNTGIGLNNLLPIRMVSEPVQLVLITRRYNVPFPTALATLVAGNVMDIFATLGLMGLGVILIPSLRGASIQLGGFVALAVVSLGVFLVAARGLGSVPIARNMRFFQQMTIAVGVMKETPGRLIISFMATATSWGMMGLAGWVLARGLGIDTDPVTMAIVLVAATFFTSAVPSLPAGLGTYHWAVVYTLGLLNVGQEDATAFAFVMHLLVFFSSTGIASVMLWRVGASVLLGRPAHTPTHVPAGASEEHAS